MEQHFLQSPAWEEYEHLEGHRTFRITNGGPSVMAVLEHTVLGNYLFAPYGPAAKSKVTLETTLLALKKLAQEQNAFFVRLEPTTPFPATELETLGLRKSHDIDPAHTWILDLTQPEAQIFADMEKEKGRLWRNYHKKNITIRQTQNPAEVDILVTMLDKVGSQNYFIPQKKIHLRRQMEAGFATLYIAELKGRPIAAALVYDHNGVRYCAHAAADYEHRKLAAGAILLVQMIVDAKRAGMKTFDFWGITTSTDTSHPWYGFTEFKKSFGGKQVDYAGTWDLPVQKPRYYFYKMIRKINRTRRRLWHKK